MNIEIEKIIDLIFKVVNENIDIIIPVVISLSVFSFSFGITKRIIRLYIYDSPGDDKKKDTKEVETKVIEKKNIVSENIVDYEEDSPIKIYY